jgi:hypothetical protein
MQDCSNTISNYHQSKVQKHHICGNTPRMPMCPTADFDTGGKPSTWFPPGKLVEQCFVTRIECSWCVHCAAGRAGPRARAKWQNNGSEDTRGSANTRTHAPAPTQTPIWQKAKEQTTDNNKWTTNSILCLKIQIKCTRTQTEFKQINRYVSYT